MKKLKKPYKPYNLYQYRNKSLLLVVGKINFCVSVPSWEQIYSLYLATQNILLHLQHNSVVEYKIFNSPLAASPPPQRFGASFLIMAHKTLLQIINLFEPDDRDEALRNHLKIRHYDEIFYLLDDLEFNRKKKLILRMLEDYTELDDIINPRTLEDEMKIALFIKRKNELTLTELENRLL